ncbi:hypothetical protein [Salinimicrobium sp. GXAS 041]|uniref:hypothetical protein n=1 Tax=Salinimicrobium sp. GXAS 041 TaxID=3400806 RepID=UPI003C78A9C7
MKTTEEILKPLWDYVPDQIIGMIDEQLEELIEEQKSASVNAKLQEAGEQNQKLRSALEAAVIGLEWEIENRPELNHRADEEKLQEWKELISSLQIKQQ